MYVFEGSPLLLARDVGVPHVAVFLGTLDIGRDCLQLQTLRRRFETLPSGGDRHRGKWEGEQQGACGFARVEQDRPRVWDTILGVRFGNILRSSETVTNTVDEQS